MLVAWEWGRCCYKIKDREDQEEHLTPAQRNSSVEKKLLVSLLAHQYCEVYLPSHDPVIEIYFDHPLQFLSKFKFKNQRKFCSKELNFPMRMGV